MARFQWHASSLQMLAKCGVQFERRYLLGERLRPGMGAVTGTGVDRSVTHNLQTRMDSGKAAPESDCLDAARDAVEREWELGVAEDADFKRNGSQARAKAVDDAVRLAQLHYRTVAPTIFPAAVQREWVIDDSSSGAQLVGTIDILNRLPGAVEGRAVKGSILEVLDTKTAKRSPSENTAHDSLQLTAYALAMAVVDKVKLPIAVGLDYMVKTTQAQYVALRSTRKLADFAHLAERLRRAEEIRKAGAFQPAPLDAWWCSADWCGYHATCPYARKPKSVVVPDATKMFQQSLIQIQERGENDAAE